MIRPGHLAMPRKGTTHRQRPARAMARGLAMGPAILVAALALLAAPVHAAASTSGKPGAKPRPRLTAETPLVAFQAPTFDNAQFSFTASGSNPATARAQSVERAFRFTPSGQGESRRAVSFGLAARVSTPSTDRSRAGAPAETGLAGIPAAYSADLSVAWRGFSVNTAINHSETAIAGLPAQRDSLGVGIGYGGRNWRTRLQGNAEQSSLLYLAPLQTRYSFELGGAYLVAPRLSVTGGVRYRLAPDTPSLIEPNASDRAVYLGTNIAF
ncbi:hypothetical protein IP88_14695 [alpha proteobacterium AAP81b]|nr:hypothetical protein IP88_14695 [alpha proteobacterium AAP81b]